MAYSKAQIYNLAANALLLQTVITDTENDKSNAAKVFNLNWDLAWSSTLEDLDLDSTSSQVNLALQYTNPISLWNYAYAYPADCAFARRIQSSVRRDNRDTKIPMRIGIYMGQKVIFTNAETPVVLEYISTATPIATVSANCALAVAHKLAMLAAPLITGKGAKALMDQILQKYIMFKTEAQELDRRENLDFPNEYVESEFVNARIGGY